MRFCGELGIQHFDIYCESQMSTFSFWSLINPNRYCSLPSFYLIAWVRFFFFFSYLEIVSQQSSLMGNSSVIPDLGSCLGLALGWQNTVRIQLFLICLRSLSITLFCAKHNGQEAVRYIYKCLGIFRDTMFVAISVRVWNDSNQTTKKQKTSRW